MTFLNHIGFKKPSAMSLAQIELENNQRSLLEHQTAALYSTKMVEYYAENIKRLREYVSEDA